MNKSDKNKNIKTIRGYAGDVRRSKLVSTAGPGAIIDLAVRPTGEPVSGVVAGIEEWGEPDKIQERRLQTKYNLKYLGMPPIRQRDDMYTTRTMPMVRFPNWLQCPFCKTLRPTIAWAKKPSDIHHPGRYCTNCKTENDDNMAVVPVRFITACEHGHLDEFPWQQWISCTCSRRDVQLRLEQQGAGLAGLVLQCTNTACPGHQPRSLKGIFGEKGLLSNGLGKCAGKRPWLWTDPDCDEQCDATRRVLQRGASNVYWPEVDSALDIPPFEGKKVEILEKYIDGYLGADTPQDQQMLIRLLKLDQQTNMSAQQIHDYYMNYTTTPVDEPLTVEEYKHFMSASDGPVRSQGCEFELDAVRIPDEFEPVLEILVQAHKLREVRLLHGFTRIFPPSGAFSDGTVTSAPISREKLDWLPAVELRGEGLFFALDLEKVRQWESKPCVVERVEALKQAVREDLYDREEFPVNLDARMILLHSLSHALMTRLTLSCGYSNASLIERIYSRTSTPETPGTDMAGILIHTGSPDADGTLGGLVEQGESTRFGQILLGALTDNLWCSSDPLCISGTATLSSARNGAACHACLLVPETSCTMFNRYLDRALLVGEPGTPELGFFSHLLHSQGAIS